ncbi:MAG: flagellar basal-body MS-ring/collar protein FliF [Polyangiaceae bacterium]
MSEAGIRSKSTEEPKGAAGPLFEPGAGPPSPVARALGRLRALSKPVKILIGTTAVVVALVLGWFAWRSSNENYAVLFSDLSEEDAASVVAKLKELKVPYRVADGGRVSVPEARVHELRLEIAGAGLRRGGSVGFETFDKPRLGATEFEQKVLYRRALEGELVRTISSISSVASARVHIVSPEKSVLLSRREPGSASVVVKLAPGRQLDPPEVAAIVNLVAAAVPGLSPDHVALATTEGVLLKKPRAEGAEGEDLAADDSASETRALESALEARAREILERVVGPGHADVRVSAELDFSKVERTEDHYQPDKRALRSEELSVEKQADTLGDRVAGVPGAESNLPTEDDGGDGEADPEKLRAVVRHQHTRNFEVDHVAEKTSSHVGRVRRLSVAVLVDGVMGEDGVTMTERDPREIERLTSLVRGAVGIDDSRADVLTVESIPFALAAAEAGEPQVAAAPAEAAPREAWKKWAPYAGGGALLVLLIVIVAARRRRRRREEIAEAHALAAAATPPVQIEANEVIAIEDKREMARRKAEEDPATAALVIRHWLGGADDAAVRDAA